MVKLNILLIFFFLIQTFSYAQGAGKVIEYDLGQISPSEVISRQYELKEEIKNAVSMCECVKVNVIKKDKVSLIEIEFNPSGYNGLVVEEVKLLDKNDSLITLRLKAYVK